MVVLAGGGRCLMSEVLLYQPALSSILGDGMSLVGRPAALGSAAIA